MPDPDILAYLTDAERRELDRLLANVPTPTVGLTQHSADAQAAQQSLLEFQRQAWHVVEPNTVYHPNWHIEAIAAHLEAVTCGDIRNLLINIPPRCEKSLNVAVFWPAWAWTHSPHLRWLFASYADTLAVRDSVKCRRLIMSPWYQERWGTAYRLTTDQNVKGRYENDKTGYRIATSVGGVGTGEGGDFVIVDDPHNVKEGESEAKRQAALDWWDLTMSTRLNNPDTGGRVIVMQRVHELDLAGHVLEQGGYEHLCLPMRYEGKPCVTVLGDIDPRTEDGQLLWPNRFTEPSVKEIELRLGPYGTAGQLQQRPAPRGGGMFKREWFEIVPAAPPGDTLRFWDQGASEGAGDYTVGVKMRRTASGKFYVIDVVRGQWASGPRDAIIRQTAQMDGTDVEQRGEQEPGASGKDAARAFVKLLVGFRARCAPSSGDKVLRADPLAAYAAAGNVALVRGDWNKVFLDELAVFPAGAHDDQVDAASGAFNALALHGEPVIVGPTAIGRGPAYFKGAG